MMNTNPAIASMIFNAHPDEEQWLAAAVADIAGALATDLLSNQRARLLVSGGSTPVPIYRALATQPLDWARIDIALVDERWLPPGDPNSNAHLIESTLLIDRATAARFEPLLLPGRNLADSVHAANASAGSASVLLLGMGTDGHTASLFPGMRDFDQVLANPADYCAVDASTCPGAGPWPQRISMTPAGMARARTRILLIRGEQKRKILERVLRDIAPGELPVHVALTLPGSPLLIHWCP